MDFAVSWSPRAVGDLEEIADFIARDSQVYARVVVTRLLSATDYLADFPRMGRRVPELDDESYREVIVYKYRLIYRLVENHVEVIAVIHGARQMPDAINDR